MRFLSTLLATVALSASSLAQTTWYADDLCTQADFASAQAAIDAAADGDVIVVRNGAGNEALVIDGKALTLVGNQGFLPGHPTLGSSAAGVIVRNTAPGQTVSLRGLDIRRQLQVLDCDGPVWIEGCLFTPTSAAGPTATIRDSDRVVMLRCDVDGGSIGNLGRDALQVDSGRAFVYGSTLTGGSVSLASGVGKDGGDGVRVLADGFVLLDDTAAQGGAGGDSLTCAVGGDGGAGLRLSNPGSTAWVVNAVLDGGSAGNTSGLSATCPDGVPGENAMGNGLGNLVDLGGASRSLSAPAAVIAGTSFELQLDTQPGDHTFVLVSMEAAPLSLSAFDGALLPSLGTSILFDFGALSGTLPTSLPAGLAPVGMPVNLVMQPLTSDGGDKRSGAGTRVTVLDPGQAELFACAGTLWVDDDAPNDPGPGDTSVSDPLEDGSADHPFDTIAEALAVAHPGNEIVVRDGSHSGTATILIDDLILRSENGPDACTIGFVDITSAADRVRLEGLTVDGGFESIEAHGDDARIIDCVITGATQGIEVAGDGTLIEGCTITQNTAGIDKEGSGQLTVRDSVLENNSNRGIIIQHSGDVDLIDCSIRANGNGGLLLTTTGVQNLFMERCEVVDNGHDEASQGTLHVTNAHTAMILRNSLFAENRNKSDAAVLTKGPLQADHCTFVNNGKPFPTIQCSGTPDLEVTLSHCIVWGPSIPVSGTPMITLDHCLVESGNAGVFSTQPVTILGPLLDVPPGFVHTPTSNYHLGPTSPCIDAGDPAYELEPGDTDIDGQPRLQGTLTDIGADERVQ